MKISLFKIVFALVFFLSPFVVFAGSQHNMSGFAWSSNIGWISFNSLDCDVDKNGFMDSGACGGDNTTGTVTNYGVNKNPANEFGVSTLIGFAWSPHVGWIQFGNLITADFPTGGGTVRQNATMGADGKLTGWAKAINGNPISGWDGWISLSGNAGDGGTYGVTLTDTAGTFATSNEGNGLGNKFMSWFSNLFNTAYASNPSSQGFAWGSDVVGAIDFSGVRAPKYPELRPGPIDISSIVATLQPDSNLSWYSKVFKNSLTAVRDTFISTAYASGAVVGFPTKLSTYITNYGLPTTETFTNRYFIDIGNNDPAGPGDSTGWDLTYTTTTNGVGSTPVESSIIIGHNYNPTAPVTLNVGNGFDSSSGVDGLPLGGHGIVFCADWNGDVSDPAQPKADRCSQKMSLTVGEVLVDDGSNASCNYATKNCYTGTYNDINDIPETGTPTVYQWTCENSGITTTCQLCVNSATNPPACTRRIPGYQNN